MVGQRATNTKTSMRGPEFRNMRTQHLMAELGLTTVAMASTLNPPRLPPPALPVKTGRYCIKVVARKRSEPQAGDRNMVEGRNVAHVEGYDTDLSIVSRVCQACERRCAKGEVCTEPDVIFIAGNCGRACDGEMYLTANGTRSEIYS